ncbi:MAG: TerC family protein [Bdellovibrionales bacterium]|nr:TerC family protein [Bdellovibrionales bacterium]
MQLGNITTQDLFTVGFLVFLEGILSIDNALVLAMLAKDLPKDLQKKALTYGLGGAIVFRLLSLSVVTQLLAWNWVKFVGGGYLLFISLKHFFFGEGDDDSPKKKRNTAKMQFWKVVLLVELTDIAFAVDSILAAVALSNKFWVVFTGGIMGVILMRYAASVFIRLLERFPAFETAAYILVFIIGVKVSLEGTLHYYPVEAINFHSPSSAAFWIFWAMMAAGVAYGFMPKKRR